MNTSEKGKWIQTLWNPIKEIKKSPLESDKPGVKVAAYCRVSAGVKERVNSLENQVSRYTHLIKNRPNWKFVGIYFDKSSSGANLKRSGIQRLLRHCKEGRVDMVLTKNVSRLSRNSEELLDMVENLKELGVGIYFEKENIDTSIDYNKFLLSSHAALAQEEIETISQSIKWGIEKKLMGGVPRYSNLLGYDIVKCEGVSSLEINEQEADSVRRIFDLFLSGLSLKAVARQLISEGIKTSLGRDLWKGSAVKDILSNPTYTGDKITRLNTRNLFTGAITTEGKDKVLIEHSHPAIIDKKTFALAQKRLDEIKAPPSVQKRQGKTPLSGRMQCGHCGHKLIKHPTKGVNYWRCAPSFVGACERKSIRENLIFEMMLKAIQNKYDLDEPKVLQEIIKRVNQNDHFEFHRLKFLTEIEIARKEDVLTAVEIEQMEKAYLTFEEKITKVEDDRKYRVEAINWLKEIHCRSDFINGASIEILRAWATEIKIYSSKDYIIRWIDGSETVMGDCSSYGKAQFIKPDIKEGSLSSTKGKRQSIPYEEIKKEEGGDDLKQKPNREVVTIKPGQGGLIMSDLQNKLEKEKSNSGAFKNISEGKKRTVAYCRVSTERNEQQISLKTQVAYYTYLILKNPDYEYAGIYADEGISGKSLNNRTELLKLIDECKAGKVDLILTKSISRFSRNVINTLSIVRMLKSLPNPVHIYFEKENINTKDQESELMLSIYGSIAQEESSNIGEAVSWGKKSYAERGIVNNSEPYYGFEKGTWNIIEKEAEVIRKIYQRTLEGQNFNQIAKELTDEGVKTPLGKRNWYLGVVRNILKNEVYKGDVLYQKYYMQDTKEGVAKLTPNKGELPQMLIENHHKGIVSREVWDKVQEIIKKRKDDYENKERRKYPKENIKNEAFVKKFYCECGALIGHSRRIEYKAEGNPEIHIWRCYAARKITFDCRSLSVREEYIELHFKKMLNYFKGSKTLKDELEKVIAKEELSDEDLRLEDEYRKEIEVLNQQLYEAVDGELNKDGQDSEKVAKLTEKIVDIQNKIKELENRKLKVNSLKADLRWLIRKTKNEITNFPGEIFTRIIESGKILTDGRIIYKLKFGVEWTIDFKYEDYKKSRAEKRAAKREAKRQEFLHGPEVRALLKYCEEQKSFLEMVDFMNSYICISKTKFRATILNSLLEDGRLKRTLPKWKQKEQRYYSVKDES
ncbi:recombinase family protein [Proteinivorax tanatarense]|uniref:Recombinase family protein n=1 Tax=Proteinivorax tanatarense TaxID=1260629 RepID=A0AAU7VI81_9FIRM